MVYSYHAAGQGFPTSFVSFTSWQDTKGIFAQTLFTFIHVFYTKIQRQTKGLNLEKFDISLPEGKCFESKYL